MLHTNFELKHVKSISEVPREVLTSTDNNDDEVLETSTVTNPAQSALSGFWSIKGSLLRLNQRLINSIL